jgi:hypothetical protein
MDHMQTRLEALEQRPQTFDRHLRWWRSRACALIVLGLLTWALPLGTAEEEATARSLAQRLAALEQKLRLTTPATAPAGRYTLGVRGTAGALVCSMTFPLDVDCPPTEPEEPPSGPTWLGVLHTQEEVWCWRQRAGIDPQGSNGLTCPVMYVEAGDVSTNSPEDWDRIQSLAEALTTGSGGNNWWSGNTCTGGWDCPPQPDDPEPLRETFEATMAAAFSWLVSGNATHLNKFKTQMLAFYVQPGVDFTDTNRWDTIGVWDTGPYFTVNILLSKLFLGYTWTRDQFTPAEQASIDAWWLEGAVYWESVQQTRRFTAAGDFTDVARTTLTSFDLSGLAQTQSTSDSGVDLWCNGPFENQLSGIWNNRYTTFTYNYGMIGIYYNRIAPTSSTAALVHKTKRWIMEYLLYGVYTDNTPAEFRRSLQANIGPLGWRYSWQVGQLVLLADALARQGDTELYDMETGATTPVISTRAGGTGYASATTWAAGKSLRTVIERMQAFVEESAELAAANCGSATFPDDYQGPYGATPGDTGSVLDIGAAAGNKYWQDTCTAPNTCIQTIYLRSATGTSAYASGPAQGGTEPWGGIAGILPGALFMLGQMEHIDVYP